jgi:tRNA modification GTPase
MIPLFMYERDTIAAIATPPGEGGVAIVRISGTDAEAIAARIFARSSRKNAKLKSHMLYHGKIVDPRTERTVDEVLATVMRKPRSYTGEDVVEIHGHGGAFLARQVLGVVLAQGARQAEPGEFTKRAFLNGRLDLAQAEAVLDLVRSRTDRSAELALHQVGGELSGWVDSLREELLEILVQVEAAIDFPEEEIELLQRRELLSKTDGLRRKIGEIIVTYEWGRLFREGAKVCICGRPNVGKSSLLNALLGEDRVIVTALPGTTRDVIEESVNLDGLPAVIWDTAGIHETSDEIERIGVQLSRAHVEKADAVIFVVDGSQPLTAADRDLLTEAAGKKVLLAVNKNDLPQAAAVDELAGFAGVQRLVRLAARTGEGVRDLKESLRQLIIDGEPRPAVVITNLRHKSALVRASRALENTAAGIAEGHAPEFIAVELNQVTDALAEIIGRIQNEDILERIFNDFCVGK